MKFERVVPDTSVLIEGIISQQHKALGITSVVVHEATLAELEHQANAGRVTGLFGLEEIEELRKELKDNLSFAGQRPRSSDIRYAKLGEIDAQIRQLAFEEEATLITADRVQYKVALARGVKAHFIEQKKPPKLELEKFFDATTMSVHLREDTIPVAKKGSPGSWEFAKLGKKTFKRKDVRDIAKQIVEVAEAQTDGFIELERKGSTVVQLGKYRIVITRPPFADGWEITAVKAIKQLTLEEYKLSEKLFERICEQAEGILIAGSPGMGKSTFAAALTLHYAKEGKIVKTIEAPRDLVLPPEVTQYAISHGSPEEIHDVLLLSRPDYTLFDEMRNTEDFRVYADLRLAGIGLAGVIHGATPVDAIQRFVGRLELGVIPHVVDTVIFIKDGQVANVLSLKMEVKVPAGMTEADLARPVVVIKDFETNKLKYELYSYGEETVLIPVQDQQPRGVNKLAQDALAAKLRNYDADVEVVSANKAIVKVPEHHIAKLVGKQGKNIQALEQEVGLSLDVQELKEERKGRREEREHGSNLSITTDKNNITLHVNNQLRGRQVHVFAQGDRLLTALVGKKGSFKVHKKSPEGKILLQAMKDREEITVAKA
tara:strand:+ start:239 stop:2041 length:1803 start_codon:yes stop_codon:yes gene_type:complete